MRLILVEDNEPLAQNLTEVFKDEGHEVAWAPTGAEALAAAGRQGFDLALVDVRLPDGAGTALIGKLKTLAPDAEVIVSSGNADLESAIAAVQAGAFSYLLKPVSVPELMLTLSRAYERVQLRRQARALQEELSQSERRYRDMVDTAQVLILALDRNLTITFANAAAQAVTGFDAAQLVGHGYLKTLVNPAEWPRTQKLLEHAFAAPTLEQEMELRAADGGRRVVRVRWARRHERDEDTLFGIGLDVTRQLQLERERRTSEKLAAVGTLTAGLAHEIRNPLNAALLQLTLAERRIQKLPTPDRAPVLQPLEMVRTELSRLTRLLSDFLAFARPREFGRTAINLSQLVADLADMHQAVAHASQRQLVLHIQPNLHVAGDGDALKAAVVNILKNGLEASRAKVTVTLETQGPQAVLRIEDDGPGITDEQAARLFEPFFTTKEQGTGLGLAMVYTVVNGHGGEIALRSRPEGGAVARMALPLVPPALNA